MKEFKLTPTFSVFLPKIDFFCDKIINNEYFYFVKYNHGFWEIILKLNDAVEPCIALHGEEFVLSSIELLHKLPKEFLIGASPFSVPDKEYNYEYDCKKIQDNQLNKKRLNSIGQLIEGAFLNRTVYYGNCWKDYFMDGSIKKIINLIRDKKVILVGLSYIEEVIKGWKLKNCVFYKMTLEDTYRLREVEEDLLNLYEEGCVYVVQAGTMLAAWLGNHLYTNGCKNAWYIDFGRVLDSWCDVVYSKEDWEIAKKSGKQVGFYLRHYANKGVGGVMPNSWLHKRKEWPIKML